MVIRVTEDDGSQWVDAETFDELLSAASNCANQITRWHQLVADGELSADAALESALMDAEQLATICMDAA